MGLVDEPWAGGVLSEYGSGGRSPFEASVSASLVWSDMVLVGGEGCSTGERNL